MKTSTVPKRLKTSLAGVQPLAAHPGWQLVMLLVKQGVVITYDVVAWDTRDNSPWVTVVRDDDGTRWMCATVTDTFMTIIVSKDADVSRERMYTQYMAARLLDEVESSYTREDA